MPAADEVDTIAQTGTDDDDVAAVLRLAGAQIRAAVADAAGDVEGLTSAALAVAASPSSSDRHEVATELLTRAQFADRLRQRLTNVSTTLDRLADRNDRATGGLDVPPWSRFLAETRAAYTMEAERELFDQSFQTDRRAEPMTVSEPDPFAEADDADDVGAP